MFEAVYMTIEGHQEQALLQIAETPLDLSMSYNLVCVYSELGDKTKTISYLRRHFYDYEFTDLVREKEMWEARSDINFKWLFEDPDFLAVTDKAEAQER